MKGFLMAVAVIGVIAGLYFAYIAVVGKTMKAVPQDNTVNVGDQLEDQSRKSQDIMLQQRRLMEERQSRMRDLQKR